MKNILIGMAVLIIVGGAVYIFIGRSMAGGLYPTNQNQTTQTLGTEVNVQSADMVDISNFAFTPQTLTVTKGATVTWTNRDTVTHQIKSDTFNSQPLAQGETFQFTFNTPGTYNYSCSIHPSMTGTIIVQ